MGSPAEADNKLLSEVGLRDSSVVVAIVRKGTEAPLPSAEAMDEKKISASRVVQKVMQCSSQAPAYKTWASEINLHDTSTYYGLG